jgi:hypothetical protein
MVWKFYQNEPAPSFFVNLILICYCRSQLLEFCHVNTCVVLPAFTSKSTSLLASCNVHVVLVVTFILSRSRLTHLHRSEAVSHSIPIHLNFLNFQFAYLIANLKNSGNKNISPFQKILKNETLQKNVSIYGIYYWLIYRMFISLTSYVGGPVL